MERGITPKGIPLIQKNTTEYLYTHAHVTCTCHMHTHTYLQSRFCTNLQLPSYVQKAASHIAEKAVQKDLAPGWVDNITVMINDNHYSESEL